MLIVDKQYNVLNGWGTSVIVLNYSFRRRGYFFIKLKQQQKQIEIMVINLRDCKLITSQEYCELVNPVFEGQTVMDSNNQYYMVFSCDGVLYKTFNTL